MAETQFTTTTELIYPKHACSYLGMQAFVKRFPTKTHIFKCVKAGS